MFYFEGTLENGERCVDAASFTPRLHHQRQIDQTLDQKRSRLLRPDQPRGYQADGSNIISMQVFGVVPQINTRALRTADPSNTNTHDDETSGGTGRTRLKRRAPSGEMQQGHPTTSEYGVVVVSMFCSLLKL